MRQTVVLEHTAVVQRLGVLLAALGSTDLVSCSLWESSSRLPGWSIHIDRKNRGQTGFSSYEHIENLKSGEARSRKPSQPGRMTAFI